VILDVRLRRRTFTASATGRSSTRSNGSRGSEPIDALTVSEFFQAGRLEAVGGRDVVARLSAKVPAPGSARHYAQIVKQNALMRRLDAAATRIQQSVAERDGEPTEMVEQAERLLFQVAHRTGQDFHRSPRSSREVDRLEELARARPPAAA
jgi:replicative DNA helicase